MCMCMCGYNSEMTSGREIDNRSEQRFYSNTETSKTNEWRERDREQHEKKSK